MASSILLTITISIIINANTSTNEKIYRPYEVVHCSDDYDVVIDLIAKLREYYEDNLPKINASLKSDISQSEKNKLLKMKQLLKLLREL